MVSKRGVLMSDFTQQAQKMYQDFVVSYLVQRDREKTLSYFMENACRIGTGLKEYTANKDELRELLTIELNKDKSAYAVQWDSIAAMQIDERSVYITAFFSASKVLSDGESFSMNTRNTCLVCVNKEGIWKIQGLHSSTPMVLQGDTEFYPLLFGEQTIQEIRETIQIQAVELMNCSITGGIMGGYLEEGHPLYIINDKMLEYLGYTYDEFVTAIDGKIINCVYPEDREMVDKIVEASLETADEYIVKYRMVKKDGSIFWVMDRGKRILDEKGRPAVISLCIDISDMMLLQEKLQETAEKLRNKNMELEEMTNNVPCGVVKYNAEDTSSFAYVSDGFCKLTGYSEQELEERFVHYMDIIHVDQRQQIQNKMQAQYENKRLWNIPLQLEYMITTKDGKDIWVAENTSIIEEKQNVYRYSVITDITDNRRIHQDLQILASNIPGGVCRIRLDEDLTLLYGNEGFYKLYGYTKHQMNLELGNRLIAAIHQVDIPSIMELMNHTLHNDETMFEYENRIFRRDGRMVWLLTRGNLTRDHEDVIMNCVVLDITDRKHMEQELSINEERMRIALAQTSNIVFDYDIMTKTILMTDRIADYYHLPRVIRNVPESLEHMHWLKKEYLVDLKRIFEKVAEGEACATCEIKSNNNKWTRVTLTSIYSEMGKPVRAVGVSEDITIQRQAEIAYAKEEQYRRAMLLDTEAYVEINLSQNLVEKSWGVWTIYDQEGHKGNYDELLYTVTEKMIHKDDQEEYYRVFNRENLMESFCLGKTEIQLEHRRKNQDGNMVWMLVTIHLIKDLDGEDLKGIAYLKDIQRRKQEELILQYQSKRDILTGVYNKGAAEALISEMLAGAMPDSQHGLMLVDIDNFKHINEHEGHLFGDKLLCCIARKIRELFCFDDIIARTGGDEFMIFMKDVLDLESIHRKAAGIVEVVHQFSEIHTFISCSIGVSVYPKDGHTYEELYQSTEIALCEAKKLRCNHAVFYGDDIAYKNHKPITINHFDYHTEYLDQVKQEITEEEKIVTNPQLLLDSVRNMISATTLEAAAVEILKTLGIIYEAQNTYVFEMDHTQKRFVCRYQWVQAQENNGVKNFWKTQDMLLAWQRMFPNNEPLKVYNTELLKEDSVIVYDELKRLNIKSFYAVPFQIPKFSQGFIAMENFNVEKWDFSFMESLSYFLINEMTKRKLNGKFEFMSYHDLLTGLPNRNSYTACVESLTEHPPASIGVIEADINGLKELNDSYGNKQGDTVIIEITKIFQAFFPIDKIFRLDGDEFVIFCPDIAFNDFHAKVQALKEELVKSANRSVSIGYTWEETDIDITQLLRHANERMMLAKQDYYKSNAASNKFYRPKALKQVLEFIQQGYFEVYLQPQIDIKTEKAVSAEALIRLNHPEHGLVSPGRFIPQLEQTKLIRFIDFFMFEEVCKILEQWQRTGYELRPVSVNFSRITLLEADLMAMLLSILNKYDVPRDMIEIEITETIGEMEKETLAEIGSHFQEAGFRIALDDFGTRYTSITMLTIMKFDVLKLDRSLILDLVHNEGNRIVVQSILDMCKRMGIQTVAEGVESEEQKNLLQSFGCPTIQGYYYSRPLQRAVYEEKYLGKRKEQENNPGVMV